MTNYHEIESLNSLIEAVREYQRKLNYQYGQLSEAVQHIEKIGWDKETHEHLIKTDEAMIELNKISHLANELEEALIEDKHRAGNVHEE